MNGFQSRQRSRQLQLLLLFSITLLFDVGLANDPPSPKDANKASSSGGSVALKAVIVLLGLAAVVGFCVFLVRIWQKKKREEQHARLLKLFEDDDELEVELGIRD